MIAGEVLRIIRVSRSKCTISDLMVGIACLLCFVSIFILLVAAALDMHMTLWMGVQEIYTHATNAHAQNSSLARKKRKRKRLISSSRLLAIVNEL